MGIFHPQKSIRTEIEKSSTYNCLFTEKLVAIVEIIEVKCEKSIEETEYVVTKINFLACLKLMIRE